MLLIVIGRNQQSKSPVFISSKLSGNEPAFYATVLNSCLLLHVKHIFNSFGFFFTRFVGKKIYNCFMLKDCSNPVNSGPLVRQNWPEILQWRLALRTLLSFLAFGCWGGHNDAPSQWHPEWLISWWVTSLIDRRCGEVIMTSSRGSRCHFDATVFVT